MAKFILFPITIWDWFNFKLIGNLSFLFTFWFTSLLSFSSSLFIEMLENGSLIDDPGIKYFWLFLNLYNFSSVSLSLDCCSTFINIFSKSSSILLLSSLFLFTLNFFLFAFNLTSSELSIFK